MKKRFSQRLGLTEVPTSLQVETMSEELANTIWNFMCDVLNENFVGWQAFCKQYTVRLLRQPAHQVVGYDHKLRLWMKERFDELSWFEVYDLVEFFVNDFDSFKGRSSAKKADLIRVFNRIFEEELSGYRFVGGELSPITNESEILAIEEAATQTSRLGLAGANEHLQAALRLLSARPTPDFRNSIKESISAVEALAKQLGSADSKGLADALTEFDKKVQIHAGLRAGFIKLYGYTSDKNGIRHAMLEVPDLDFDDAKYMLVSCSAFVNLLAAKAEKAGLLAPKR